MIDMQTEVNASNAIAIVVSRAIPTITSASQSPEW